MNARTSTSQKPQQILIESSNGIPVAIYYGRSNQTTPSNWKEEKRFRMKLLTLVIAFVFLMFTHAGDMNVVVAIKQISSNN